MTRAAAAARKAAEALRELAAALEAEHDQDGAERPPRIDPNTVRPTEEDRALARKYLRRAGVYRRQSQ